jgi:[ribosomal protein S18]-alanine N-acetyltransferase
MWPFRRDLPATPAVQLVGPADLPEIQALFARADRCYDLLYPDQIALSAEAALGVTARRADRLVGVLLLSRPLAGSSWIRAAALTTAEASPPLLAALLDGLLAAAAGLQLQQLYYGADEQIDDWMVPALRKVGFRHLTDVVVYAKYDGLIPAVGHPAVHLRPAVAADLAQLAQLDQRCFAAEWLKDAPILMQALHDGVVTVAETDDAIVGYSYISRHFAGRLAHLVRIAVDPASQHQQIGVRLLADFVVRARAGGAETLTLNTQAFNAQAQRLYQWFGFLQTGERQLIWQRTIDSSAAGTTGAGK